MIKLQENEQLLISTILKSEEKRRVILNIIINPEQYFVVSECRSLFSIIKRLQASNKTITIDVVSSFCPQVDFASIKHIWDNYGEIPSDGISDHLKLLRRNALEYDVDNSLFSKIVDTLKSTETVVEAKLNSLKDIIEAASLRTVEKDLGPKNIVSLVDEYKKLLEYRKQGHSFYTTGDIRLDGLLNYGFPPQQITLMVGRPSNGKSLVALDSARKLANLGIPAVLFNLEMKNESMMDRLVGMGSQIPVSKLSKFLEEITVEEDLKIQRELERMSTGMTLFMDDDPITSLETLRIKIARLQQRLKKEYIVVYIDLFTKLSDFSKAESALDFEKICNKIQVITQQMGIHTVLVLQINRSADKERLKSMEDLSKVYPMTNQIKNAGAFEEVADTVLLICKPSNYLHQYSWGDFVSEYIRIEVGKQRHGSSTSFSQVLLYKNPKEYLGLVTPEPDWDPLVIRVDESDINKYMQQ